jgi:hypothetical protein
MNYTKLVEKVVVTFVEAAVAYLSLNSWNFNSKTVVAGAVGAGVSAAYNVVKQLKG